MTLKLIPVLCVCSHKPLEDKELVIGNVPLPQATARFFSPQNHDKTRYVNEVYFL